MEVIGKRLRGLRDSIGLTQAKLAALMGATQTKINRYETNNAAPPPEALLWYADYFDVSLDYIYGRTDEPRGKLYDYKPKALLEQTEKHEELRQFVEMCFDPTSAINERLKETLLRMLVEGE